MSTLIIRDVGAGEDCRFQVSRVRGADIKSTESVEILSPVGFPVEGRPNSELMRDLRWYLERFLDYPFPPQTDIADRVKDALKGWGEQAFLALFGSGLGSQFFHDAAREGLDQLHLRISSDDPRILGWPWEALHDPQSGFLAPTCQIERQLNQIRDPYSLPDTLPRDRVNILLVTCRPFRQDVPFRSLSRPLVELVVGQDLPAEVTVLRPPTFDRLREHLLHERPGYYQVVHFDGHGAYRAEAVGPIDQHALGGPIGKLAFEDVEGKPDLKDAEQLAALLRDCRIPAVVMNACQSGMVDDSADDPFASVAAAMLRAGVRSVVAMAYSLYVSGAKEFLPCFYQALFRTGDIAKATRAGRQQMLARRGRVCVRGRFDLDDWLVPVVYQQEALDLSFASQARPPRPPSDAVALPPEARDDENPYGFIGRDGPILELERAMHLPRAGILIQGLGGVGKTTLARGFVRWLKETGGLGRGCLWFTFQGIRTAEYVINRMAESLVGTNAIPLPMETKFDLLVEALKADRVLVVWDNFETVRGIPGTSVEASLPAEDQDLLRTLLRRLRGGKSKVLITSRSTEDWLGDTRLKVGLGGLAGEERWEYCETILRDLGKSINRADPDLNALMDLLAGHPLAMRVILPRLEDQTAARLGLTLRDNLASLGPSGDEVQDKLFATLRFAEDTLPADLCPLLIPLALHEHFLQIPLLEAMAQEIDPSWTRDRIDQFVAILVNAGLLRGRGQASYAIHLRATSSGPGTIGPNDHGQAIYEIHPALSGFLRSSPRTSDESIRDPWCEAFATIMGSLSYQLIKFPFHEQRGLFSVHSANFLRADKEAERLGLDEIAMALNASQAFYAQDTWNHQRTDELWQRVVDSQQNERLLAVSYGQRGMIALDRGELETARSLCGKALEIFERLGDECEAATSHYNLGTISFRRGDLDSAEDRYRKALEIYERFGNDPGAAPTYNYLGQISQARGDMNGASSLYKESLNRYEKLNSIIGIASTKGQLGILAQQCGDLDSAERQLNEVLVIFERLEDRPRAAMSFHQLGILAQLRGDLDSAERRFNKAIEINEQLGNKPGAALSYGNQGGLAFERGDLETAEYWYTKALDVFERSGNEPNVAMTYSNLGSVAWERGDLNSAERLYKMSLDLWVKTRDEQNRSRTQDLLDKMRESRSSG